MLRAKPQPPRPAGPSPAPAAASPAPAAGRPPRRRPAPAAPTLIHISDIGSVAIAQVATTGYARTNGQPSLTITVSKNANANTVDVADAVQAKLAQIAASHPELKIVTVSDLSTFIKESRDGLLHEGGLGALFAVITIFLFLFSLRSTLVAAVSIPLSVLTALVVMQVTGITLNIMTLGGLAVAVGRVVDDAIVVLENIYRHRAMGEDRLTAVLQGPREVAGAITSSTLTTVAVFLPIGFVGGIVSQFFLPFALTVTFALLASLVCALTVVPILAFLFIDRVKLAVDETGEPKNSLWVRAYAPTIRFVLRDRRTKLGVLGARDDPLHRLHLARRPPADGVHLDGLRQGPAGEHRAAGRRRLAGRPRDGDAAPRRSCARTRRCSSSRRRSPDRATRARPRSRRRSRESPPTAPRWSSGWPATSTSTRTRPRSPRSWRPSRRTATTSPSTRPGASARTACRSSSAGRTRRP